MIVTLIGSAKFEDDFIESNKQLGLRGISAFSLSAYPRDNGGKNWYSEEEKIMLDLVHLNKIRISKAVFIVGDGYIGFSTAREILWAHILDLPILNQADFEKDDWNGIFIGLKTGVNNSAYWVGKARKVLSATAITSEQNIQ